MVGVTKGVTKGVVEDEDDDVDTIIVVVRIRMELLVPVFYFGRNTLEDRQSVWFGLVWFGFCVVSCVVSCA